jgi:OOP family OmpA-OmpF porin
MKKLFVIVIIISSFFVKAQEINSEDNVDFNRWSVELNIGDNKPIRPFSSGYYTANSDKYVNISNIKHFDIGTRYMFNTLFGLKVDFAFDEIKNNSNTASLPFDCTVYRVGLQSVYNLGNLLKFNTFSNRFGLLTHLGIQASLNKYVNYSSDPTYIGPDPPPSEEGPNLSKINTGFIIGLTPQYRVTDKFSVSGDFSVINNLKQNYNWNGDYNSTDNNLTGLLYTASIGFTFYIGHNTKHADWYAEKDKLIDLAGHDDAARERIEKIEKMLEDTDRDGVPDYIDQENNTPSGIAVDSRGKFIDLNKNGVPDELERKTRDGKDGESIKGKDGDGTLTQVEFLKTLSKEGYINIFFDVNADYPNSGSTNNVYLIVKYLKNNPDATARLIGYADLTGKEDANRDLSFRRAKKLYDFIVASGVNPQRVSLSAIGVDNSFPATRTGLDLSRRVSIEIK